METGVQGRAAGGTRLIGLHTLTDGGQAAEEVAHWIAEFLDGATRTLDLALYDVHLPPALEEIVHGALVRATERGVAVRLAYNFDHPARTLGPPPPHTQPELIEALPIPTRPIPGIPVLMHHKYVVRDDSAVWTGSMNWTADSWTREENVVVVVESPKLASRFAADFEQLWLKQQVRRTGKVSTWPIGVGRTQVRPWFCPGRGEKLARRIAKAIGGAKRRVRIASPVITSVPILATLAQVATAGKVDVAGVVDATQIHEVIGQWRASGNVAWKEPSLRTALTHAPFSGKRSTPYRPGSVHDYMHAKVTVCDDVVFVGSFNLSHSGEENAENVLELADAALADQLAAFVDQIRGKYSPVELPS